MKEEVVTITCKYLYEPYSIDFPYRVDVCVYGSDWEKNYCELCSTKVGIHLLLLNIKRKLRRNFRKVGTRLVFITNLKEVK